MIINKLGMTGPSPGQPRPGSRSLGMVWVALLV